MSDRHAPRNTRSERRPGLHPGRSRDAVVLRHRDGRPDLRVDTVTDYGVTVPVFGVSQSPLIEGDHLIALLGGEPDAMVVAFDRATGAEVWRAIETTSEPGYSLPSLRTPAMCKKLGISEQPWGAGHLSY